MRVRTALGYEVELTEPVEVGEIIEVPTPEPEETSTAGPAAIKFLAHMYGLQKEWSKVAQKRYKVEHGLEHFPPYILDLPKEDLETFLVRFISAGGSLIKHYSGTNTKHIGEVRLKCIHRSLAVELQYILQRLGIRTRIVWHGQLNRWLVQTSGHAAYILMRPYIKRTQNPRLLKKMHELDTLVPFQFRSEQLPIIQDKVKEIIHV